MQYQYVQQCEQRRRIERVLGQTSRSEKLKFSSAATASRPDKGRKRGGSCFWCAEAHCCTGASFLYYRTDCLAECHGNMQHGGVHYCLVKAIVVHRRGGDPLGTSPRWSAWPANTLFRPNCWEPIAGSPREAEPAMRSYTCRVEGTGFLLVPRAPGTLLGGKLTGLAVEASKRRLARPGASGRAVIGSRLVLASSAWDLGADGFVVQPDNGHSDSRIVPRSSFLMAV